MARIAILLVDDHAVVREGYRRLLERDPNVAVVGEAANAAQAYQSFCALNPDVVVMDVSLPDVSGIEALRRIRARDARARVLMFSMHEEAIFPTRALQAGAQGYVTKSSAPDVLVEAVHAIASGKQYISHDVAQLLAIKSLAGQDNPLQALSAREFEIMRLLVAGETIGAIGRKLGLGYKTVANYQSMIRNKLQVETPAQLMALALRSGLVRMDGHETSANRPTLSPS
jgi:DNA-binding NarL/FixJ family response regulator